MGHPGCGSSVLDTNAESRIAAAFSKAEQGYGRRISRLSKKSFPITYIHHACSVADCKKNGIYSVGNIKNPSFYCSTHRPRLPEGYRYGKKDPALCG
jgi:hypothetical protein